MSKVAMIGTLTCQDGKAEEMEAVLTQMVEAAAEEPGTEIYSYHRGEGNTFWFFALMADQDAMQSHGQTDAISWLYFTTSPYSTYRGLCFFS